jgi:hypothetical protein
MKRTLVADPKAADRLLDALRDKKRGGELVRVTKADAVAATGLPVDQAEPALKALLARYRSHLSVTDTGELVYAFDPGFERRDKVPLGERMRRAGRALWKGFQVFFKVWIMVTLVVYVVAFIAMMLALLFARQSDDRDDDRGHGGGGGMFWLWFWLMPDMAPAGYYERMPPSRRPKMPKKRFYQSVFDFVFGPKGVPKDPREQDRRIVAFLRDHKGRITAAELVGLTGLSLDEADQELTRLMAEYDGEVEVADDGTLIYVFEGVLPSVDKQNQWWSWAWDRTEKQAPLTGNTPGANAVVGGFAGFNLLASLTIGPAFLARVHLLGDPLATFFVTWFPLMFSTIFFAVPGLRALAHRREARRLAKGAARKELLRELYGREGERFDPKLLSSQVAERTGQPPELVRSQLEKLLKELEGDVSTDAEGNVRYQFPRLLEEKRAVKTARDKAKALPAVGEVVFSSEDRPEPAR